MSSHALDSQSQLGVDVQAALDEVDAFVHATRVVRPALVGVVPREVDVAQPRRLVIDERRAAPDDVAEEDTQRPDLRWGGVVGFVVENL